jgi:hypothetical protein
MHKHFTIINTSGIILAFGSVPLAYAIHSLLLMFGMIAIGLALVITSLFIMDIGNNG